MSGMICMTCGAPVDPMSDGGWLHRTYEASVFCEWLKGYRADDDPAVVEQLEGLQ